jgi:hypothetical protein
VRTIYRAYTVDSSQLRFYLSMKPWIHVKKQKTNDVHP